MNHIQHTESKAYQIVSIALIAGLYVVVTMITAPLSFGVLNFRIAEALNFLGLYRQRHIYALTLGVFISNYFAFGPLDMIIGSLSTLVFVTLGKYLANYIVDDVMKEHAWKIDPMLIKYLIMAITFSLSMITIALMIVILGFDGPFLPLYGGLVISEFIAMALGGLIIYPLSKRIDLTK